MKYIVVTGGVVSGLGKGITISSMGRLLQASGLTVTAIKIDPYLNVDAGTMSPFEHGEVFVLGDGGEADLDLGNYERFLNVSLTSDHNITTGKVYRNVILKERRGDYLGKTVQVVPHVTNEIQDWLERVSKVPVSPDGKIADVCLVEVGGTVGDIESSVFLEALRQFQFRVGHENFVLCFVSLVPILSDEQKTKPTQHGVKALLSLGLSPHVIFCRCPQPLEDATKSKISSFCHVPPEAVLSVHDVTNVYFVPSLLKAQNLHSLVAKQLQISLQEPELGAWQVMASSLESFTSTVKIALIGKYNGLQDSYLSVIKSLQHAAIECQHSLDLQWVEATNLERLDENGEDKSDSEDYKAAWAMLTGSDGVIVPGGFGNR
jgi:CTP synthase